MKDFVALPLTICGPMGIVRELRRGEGGWEVKMEERNLVGGQGGVEIDRERERDKKVIECWMTQERDKIVVHNTSSESKVKHSEIS